MKVLHLTNNLQIGGSETDIALKSIELSKKHKTKIVIVPLFNNYELLARFPEFKKLCSIEKPILKSIVDVLFLKKRITKISKNIKYDSTIIDFESGIFFEKVVEAKLKYNNKNILGLFFGNTLGNFTSIPNILQKVMEPFSSNDRLLIGIARSKLDNKIWLKDLVNNYEDKKVLDFVFSTVQELGIKRKNVLLEVEFNYKESAIEFVVIFQKDTVVNIGNKQIKFKKDNKIRIGKSEKVNEIKMAKIFDNLNLRVCNLSTSDDDKYMQTCIANKNYF